MALLDFAPAEKRFPALQRDGLPRFLAHVVERFPANSSRPVWHSDWGWINYETLTFAIAFEIGASRMLEVGGGRDPAFLKMAPDLGLDLVINDISAEELARLPDGTKTACFDMAGDLAARTDLHGAFDLLTSRMVFEHIPDVKAAWRNTFTLLRPGGVGIAFFPTMYAWPFVLNTLLPDDLAKRIVERFFPARRADGDFPVFPAHYDWCYGSEKKLRRMLDPIGFSDICVLPFWGHHYLDRVPVIREIETGANWLASRLDWRFFTTYAYVIVRK